MIALDLKFCKKILNSKINEIYFLSGQSSILKSFKNPQLSLNSNVLGLINILEVIKNRKLKAKLLMLVLDKFLVITKKII